MNVYIKERTITLHELNVVCADASLYDYDGKACSL